MTYNFEVGARNIAGLGDRLKIDSDEDASATPDPIAPFRAPTLRATLGDDDTEAENPQIKLSWNVLSADYDGGSPITGLPVAVQEVYR